MKIHPPIKELNSAFAVQNRPHTHVTSHACTGLILKQRVVIIYLYLVVVVVVSTPDLGSKPNCDFFVFFLLNLVIRAQFSHCVIPGCQEVYQYLLPPPLQGAKTSVYATADAS
jgi:hypothetical protein